MTFSPRSIASKLCRRERLAGKFPPRQGGTDSKRRFAGGSAWARRADHFTRTKPCDSNWRAQVSTVAASTDVSPPRLSRAAHVKDACVLGLNILIDSGPGEELLQPKKQANPKRPIARGDGNSRKTSVPAFR